jgi:H+/Cl- antiporter ClcA
MSIKKNGKKNSKKIDLFLRLLSWSGVALLIGLASGICATLLLFSLNWATQVRLHHSQWIWGLPLAGALTGWTYLHWGRDAGRGHHLIFESIHDSQIVVPLRMAPLVGLASVLTHLCGGSAGREGAIVQMAASVSAQMERILEWIGLEPLQPGASEARLAQRRILLRSGLGAGFGAATGAPWAGWLFGLEMLGFQHLSLLGLAVGGLASGVGCWTTRLLGAPHTYFPEVIIPDWDLKTLCSVGVAGLVFGFAARVFVGVTHELELRLKSWIPHPALRPAVIGGVLIALYAGEGSYHYAGLGIAQIQNALSGRSSLWEPFWKMMFTALTVSSGFKGGEFVPLVFIGATLGNALTSGVPFLPGSFVGALGFVAVFGAASQTPLACACLAMELFGIPIGGFAAIACGVSAWSVGSHSIYRRSPQSISQKKRVRYPYLTLPEFFKLF